MINVAIVATLLLNACSLEPNDTQSKESAAVDSATPKGMVTVDLSPYGLDARMVVPGRQRTGVDPSVMLDENTSHLRVRSGKSYNVVLREEPTDMEMIKEDLTQDLMFTNEILSDDGHSILYKRSLPDGSMALFHFATVVDDGQRRVVLKSDALGEYSQPQAERMRESSLSLKLLAPIADRQ